MMSRGAFRAFAIAIMLLAGAASPINAGGAAETAVEQDGETADFETIETEGPDTQVAPPPGPPMSLSVLAGRWTGEGKLGVRDNPPESVKCRATYFAEAGETSLKQNIRCATSGGAIEVKSELTNVDGKLSGTWAETKYNMSGTLQGDVKPTGFRIVVKGEGLHANMDIIVKDEKQIVEIQFFDSTLIGLTLVLTKG